MLKCTFLLSLALSFTSAYKILLVFPFPAKSHSILGEGYVRHLIKAGHEVTYITPILIKNPPKNLRQIDVSDNMIFAPDNSITMEGLMNNEVNSDHYVIIPLVDNIANHTIRNPNVQRLIMEPKEHFDLVIAEWLTTELYCGFAAVFDCPYIWSSSMDLHELVLELIDEMPNPAYTATIYTDVKPPFTFLNRVYGLWNNIYAMYVKWLVRDFENKIYEEGFGPAVALRGRQLPSLQILVHNASMMFGDSHVSVGRPIRLPQNYIPIAGYHIDENVTPLPEDLQLLMDNSKHGVIYFSMGSVLKCATMPEKLKNDLIKMFGGLKQTVIWKCEVEIQDISANIHMVKWAPQAGILAHPNCLLFISHGGLLSIMEAVKSGVPIIGIPMFADQFNNVLQAVLKGFGKKVAFGYDTPTDLKKEIEDMIEDKMYREKAQEVSFIYHHRPVPPGQELVHWVEHVVHTRGAPHLRSPALAVPFYQKYYLDLAAVVIVLYYTFKTTFKRIFKKKTTEQIKLKNN